MSTETDGNTALDVAVESRRLSPGALPARYRVAGNPRRAGSADASVYLDGEVAVVRRLLGGCPATLTVPVRQFEGVAVRVEVIGETVITHVELAHRDPALTLPLAAGDAEAMAADWQVWSRCLRLPMLLVEADGSLRRVEPASGRRGPLAARRQRAFFAGRRPRFLMRRKPGVVGPQIVLAGREIIART